MSRAPRLLIAANLPMVEAFLLPYAQHYRALGWRVDLAANGATRSGPCREAFDATHDVAWTRSPRDLGSVLRAARTLRELVAGEGYDIVHVHNPIPALVTRWALRRLRRERGTRVVYTVHGFHFFRGGPPLRNALYRALERAAGRWTDALVVINREDLAAARRFPRPGAARVVYMPGIGIDTRRYAPERVPEAAVAAARAELTRAELTRAGLTGGGRAGGAGAGDVAAVEDPAGTEPTTVLLMVAELNPGKRHRDAVAALARCGRPDIVLACAGRGPLEGAVAEQARALGVGAQVALLGYRDDVPALLRACDALVLPSEREGLPRSIMEAMSLERPVIATRIRGVSELVSDETGVLCPVGDVAALSAAMRAMADDPARRAAMGRRARQAIAPFDLARVMALHDALYAELLGSPPVAAR